MRIYLRLAGNIEKIPFNYQKHITGAIHKWIGRDNQIHGKSGMFNFSWIQNTVAQNGYLVLRRDSYFFISSFYDDVIKSITKGILNDPFIFHELRVTDVQIQAAPHFNESENFYMASPILLKANGDRSKKIRHVTFLDSDFQSLLTENLIKKLSKAGIDSYGCSIRLCPDNNSRCTKLVDYNGIKNKTTFAPLIISGNQQQIEYAWSTGLGHSTGIGFGALK